MARLQSRFTYRFRLLSSKFNQNAVCGSSFDSYNSYGLNPLGYNSQTSFNASNNSFNTTTNTSILDQTYAGNSPGGYNHQTSTMSGAYVPSQSYASQATTPTPYKQNSVNLQAITNSLVAAAAAAGANNYSPNSSNYSNNNYDPNTSYASYDNLARKSIDDHMKKQIDEQLLTKVSQLSLEQVTKLLAQKQQEYHSTNNIILNQIHTSKEIANSCRDISNDKEEFY